MRNRAGGAETSGDGGNKTAVGAGRLQTKFGVAETELWDVETEARFPHPQALTEVKIQAGERIRGREQKNAGAQ